ncbi:MULTISPECIES: DUF1107 family protein [Vibrio]|uniref:DUF1107 family protein n=1 Tax=Vibrio algicola TaxID=2662262 RepID=A0A5Q0TG31_9VIBR|nr:MULTISPECIES: DUF1107 family protein [Vibrio]MBD1576338.1 DUF1107 family protein [Vibrio sp. S11_S32]
MRPIFNCYRPTKIARFVKMLFSGEFMIQGIGYFRFDQGRVLLPNVANKKQLQAMKEINLAIKHLSLEC